MASKLLLLRRLSRALRPATASPPLPRTVRHVLLEASEDVRNIAVSHFSSPCRSFCSHNNDDAQGPAAIDYSSLLQEDEFQNLADSTIHGLQEKLEEYGDSVQIDGFDVDYGNEVLTLKLGDLGTYVLNKQTPNRQIWLSSPVSGPSRFDWDRTTQAWVYRRTKASLSKILETELEQLCGEQISLS